VQALVRPGERVVAMRPVAMGTSQFTTYYFTTGTVADTLGEIFYSPAPGAWQKAGIQGIVVMDGANAITDEALLRQAFLSILAGYMAEKLPDLPTAITADPSLVEQLHRLTDHPLYQAAFIEQQIKSLFKTNEEMDVLALKGMLIARTPAAATVKEFTEDVKGQLATLNQVEDAIDATATVVAEARSASQQRADILWRFIKEKAADLTVKLGTDALLKLWVQTTWDTFGKRTVGHLVAGAASSVVLGFTVANLLYGMDGIYENTVIAQRAARREEIFMNGALWAKLKRPASGSSYDGEIADAYRICVLFKNLAAGQVYRSYADSIAASRLIKVLADLVTGQQWTEAEAFFRRWAEDSEAKIENLLGHPPIIEEAVNLALETSKRPKAPPIPGGSQTATAFVIDVSGSMGQQWRGGVKIGSAKQAAADVVAMIEQESQLGQQAHQVALVTFTTDAKLESPLSADYAALRDAIARLTPQENTNLGAGVAIANQALSSAPAGVRKVIILLSDGMSNTGLPKPQILAGPVQDAANAGTCIYTIGFGEPGDLDEDLLRQIAAASQCGSYSYASAPDDLALIYVRLRHESTGTATGTVLAQFQGQIAQGETVDIGQVDVPTNQELLNATLQRHSRRAHN